MIDRFLNVALRLTIIGFIMLLTGVTLVLAYYGLLDLCTSRFSVGAARVSIAITLGIASLLLCRHGNDLMDR